MNFLELDTLRQLFERSLDQQTRYHLTPPRLIEAMRYSLKNGGKRLRPVMLLAVLAIQSEDLVKCGLKTAIALEYIHTYSLIHDDLPAMDNDDLRRGQATNHKRFGEGLAILAGDALLTDAFQVLVSDDLLDDRTKLALIDQLSQAAGSWGMVAGQVGDIEAEQTPVDYQGLKQIHDQKTGALFRFALEAGAIIGGADASTCQALCQFGRHFGLAYQIHNDLMDVLGSQEVTGKVTQADQALTKSTYPSLLGLQGAKEALAVEVSAASQILENLAKESGRPYLILGGILDYLTLPSAK